MKDGEPSRRPAPRALPDDVTDVDDTVAERTVLVEPDRTVVDPRPRPVAYADDEPETLVDGRPDPVTDELEDLKRAARVALRWSVQAGRWCECRILRPGWRRLAAGWHRLVEALRWRRFEDSDAYSRRRGQQWRRFREGDPNINELREFDEKYRGESQRPRR